MIKENKKLKDLTYDEYAKFKSYECGYYGKCDNCPFRTGNCESPDSPDSWFNNQEMYSEDFLNQELQVESMLLTEGDKNYLRLMLDILNGYEIYSISKIVDSFVGKQVAYIRIIFNSHIKDYGEEMLCSPLFNLNTSFLNLKDNHYYNLEELGL